MADICKTLCPVRPQCEARKNAVLSSNDTDIAALSDTIVGMAEYEEAQINCNGPKTSLAGWILRCLAIGNLYVNPANAFTTRDSVDYTRLYPACGNTAARYALEAIPVVTPMPDPAGKRT